MINVAMLLVYNGFIKDDLTKSLAMIMAVFIFVFLGLNSLMPLRLISRRGFEIRYRSGLAASSVAIAGSATSSAASDPGCTTRT